MSSLHLQLDFAKDGVVRLRLRRPEARNALTPEMVAGIPRRLEDLAALPAEQCRVVVRAGERKFFCAGADLQAMRESGRASEAENREDARRFATLFRSVAAFPAPVIAAVQGAALGGGFGLAMCADHVIAEDTARFGTPEARLGLVPAVISPYVVRRLGPGRAGPFLLGGAVARGLPALAAGIAHELTPVGGLEDVLAQTVERFLASAPRAVRQAKALMLREAPLPSPDIEELTIRTIAGARASEEGQAGTAAFFAKRPPPWAPSSSG
ncbi:MAG: hypothetical protein F4174_12070 [Acidobacteria bacterium]|nr:hypothetical protein [Acidobacteriota bacterium]